jgi:hypothetical protein
MHPMRADKRNVPQWQKNEIIARHLILLQGLLELHLLCHPAKTQNDTSITNANDARLANFLMCGVHGKNSADEKLSVARWEVTGASRCRRSGTRCRNAAAAGKQSGFSQLCKLETAQHLHCMCAQQRMHLVKFKGMLINL